MISPKAPKISRCILSSRSWFKIRLSLQAAQIKQDPLIEINGKRREPVEGRFFLGGDPRNQLTSMVLTSIHGLPRIDAI